MHRRGGCERGKSSLQQNKKKKKKKTYPDPLLFPCRSGVADIFQMAPRFLLQRLEYVSVTTRSVGFCCCRGLSSDTEREREKEREREGEREGGGELLLLPPLLAAAALSGSGCAERPTGEVAQKWSGGIGRRRAIVKVETAERSSRGKMAQEEEEERSEGGETHSRCPSLAVLFICKHVTCLQFRPPTLLQSLLLLLLSLLLLLLLHQLWKLDAMNS